MHSKNFRGRLHLVARTFYLGQVSDDGFEDLTAHIIGMGKEEYYRVLNESLDWD